MPDRTPSAAVIPRFPSSVRTERRPEVRGTGRHRYVLTVASRAERPVPLRQHYSVGLDAVNSEQHGLPTGWNSMISARVPSGSKRLYCHLPSAPILGPLVFSGIRLPE